MTIYSIFILQIHDEDIAMKSNFSRVLPGRILTPPPKKKVVKCRKIDAGSPPPPPDHAKSVGISVKVIVLVKTHSFIR